MKRHQRRHQRRRDRRGAALYITVMSVALIVSILGLAGLTVVGIERKQSQSGSERAAARLNANSAVQIALHILDADSDWRTTYTSGVESAPLSLGPDGAGTLSWMLVDTDGSLSDADTDLRLMGIGRVGDAVQAADVTLTTSGQALNCLEVSVCTGGVVDFLSSATGTADQPISSNDSIQSSGTVNADVEAVTAITGSGYGGTTTTGTTPRSLPNGSAFNYYLSNGTAIDVYSLTKAGPTWTIRDAVLSPTLNPYGPANSEGIYVIDCLGELVRIQYSRLLATIVLLNPDPASDIDFDLAWEPPSPNYPALLVLGSIELRHSNTPLSEAARGVNFNPPGAPYEGSTDVDLADSYPPLIKGLVYVSGNAAVASNPAIEGALVVGGDLSLSASDSLTVTYDPIYLSDPPPGFTGGNDITVFPRSWRRLPAP